MNPRVREAAIWLIRARHCLIAGEVAKMLEEPMLLAQWEARFSDAWSKLPLGLRTEANTTKYLYHPVTRMIERKGLIYYRGRFTL